MSESYFEFFRKPFEFKDGFMICVTRTQMHTSGPLTLKASLSLFEDLKSAYLWDYTTVPFF